MRTIHFSLLADAGIAAFRTPESCADAVAAMLQWREPQAIVDRSDPDVSACVTRLDTALGALLDSTASSRLSMKHRQQLFLPRRGSLCRRCRSLSVTLSSPVAT